MKKKKRNQKTSKVLMDTVITETSCEKIDSKDESTLLKRTEVNWEYTSMINLKKQTSLHLGF